MLYLIQVRHSCRQYYGLAGLSTFSKKVVPQQLIRRNFVEVDEWEQLFHCLQVERSAGKHDVARPAGRADVSEKRGRQLPGFAGQQLGIVAQSLGRKQLPHAKELKLHRVTIDFGGGLHKLDTAI